MPGLRIIFGGGFGDEGDMSPYGNAEGFKDYSDQNTMEMMLNQDWKQRFADEIDDSPYRKAPGLIRQAGTSGIYPGFQG